MRRRLGTVLLSAVLLVGGTTAVPASAEPAPDGDARTAACKAQPDRGVRCVGVTAKFNHKISQGRSAALSVKLDPRIDIPGARVEIDLPAALRFAGDPDGFEVSRHSSALPANGGSVTTAVRTVDLTAGRKTSYSLPVEAVAGGELSVRVRVLPPKGYGVGIEEPVLATVGEDQASSRLGLAKGPFEASAVPEDAKPTAPTELSAEGLGTEGLAEPHSDDPAAAEGQGVGAQALTCVRGSFNYQDAGGAWRNSANLQVQVWDEDPANSDDLLTVGLTDDNGAYRLCFDNSTDARGGQDVYLVFVTQNGQWGVERDDDDEYEFRSGQRDNLGDGTTTDFGALHPTDARLHGSLRAYSWANAASAWTPGDCWDSKDTDCRRIDINWHPDDDPGGSFYRPGEDEIYLVPQDADDRNVVAHEIGHAVMDDVYDDNTFDTQCPSPHIITRTSSRPCAWSEGFGDWYGVAVFNDPVYVDGGVSPFTVDFENHTWGTAGWDNGDAVEGRVAGALWDLVDGVGEAPWDQYGEGLTNVWNTFLNHRDTTFQEYWNHRAGDGHEVGAPALGSLFQNTVDYGFRNPLTNHVPLERPTPEPDHNYRFDTVMRFWSVVAVRPPATADYDLSLYDDQAQNQLLGFSGQAAGVTDFVAVNSNRREAGDYYPRVSDVSGTGDYRIEADETEGIFSGSPTVTLGAGRLAAVWDICLTAGEKATYTVTPSGTGQDAELFVFDADRTGADNVDSRSGAAESGTAGGPGQPESVAVTLPEGCHGLVVVNKAGSGTYTLTKS
ncbi:hypothetical protein J7I98_18580 [Streptomyces sp. ISL-98]|uniref:hypothetical protein n=1 Tax=Streptomyces sp. ISL-98 TaxID=2819192 RepID=UPI001BE67F77|nr:hypothetical protein [Streptomyces sp. ISL-98]MBT2507852.1 hypothetical protein [Streptomyces sp. ISL-98]